jgi:hypothetical protein
MKVLLSAFQCSPGMGSEPGNGWHWATSLAEYGHDVTVLTGAFEREGIFAANPQGIDFRFIELPKSFLRHVSTRFGSYQMYRRWQRAALEHAERTPRQWDVAHHVTWASLHLGSMLWRLPVPFVYGPIGGGQTAPINYWRQFGRQLPAETMRTVLAGQLLTLNSRSRETLRNSTVTLVANSATASSARRLGAADVRFMMADGLPAEWEATAAQGAGARGGGVRGPAPDNAGPVGHRGRRPAGRVGAGGGRASWGGWGCDAAWARVLGGDHAPV